LVNLVVVIYEKSMQRRDR